MILEQTAARQTKLLSLLRREFGLSAGLVKRLKWQNALFVNGAPAPIPMRRSRPATGCAS